MANGVKLGLRISAELDARLTNAELKAGMSRGNIVRMALTILLDTCSMETISREFSNRFRNIPLENFTSGTTSKNSAGTTSKNKLKRMRKK